MSYDENYLIKRSRHGDAEAFSQLVQQYQNGVYRICLRSGLSPDDAEEAAQDAFVKAWQGLPQFRGDSKFSTWLYQLATHAAIDILRREKHSRETVDIDELPLPDENQSPQQAVEKHDAQSAVRRALAAVSEDYRAVLILRYMEELSYEEIGTALGLPPGTVKSRINRGKVQLKEILLQQGNLFGTNLVTPIEKEGQL